MTDGDGASARGATRSVEVELKFDVDEGVTAPDWSNVPGVASVSGEEVRELDATYLDDAQLSLARAGYALRRRTGGPDAGWHIKGPRRADGGRVELQWSLGEDGFPPGAAFDELADVTRGPFLPLARIRNVRTVSLLLDASGAVVAEFADDHVHTRDERSGVERAWQEWEVELGPAGPADANERAAFFTAVAQAAFAAGARAAASDSKLARALGH
ncbi:CYTH domain-containing protein [Microbacterium sp. HD4P20]|uniref:CYTH domain-containing protein n=1 Tax=Microbacterium sp. HD4P20 TaxID=2864874 RepID=UPI0020A4069D|nr:CYTH domain-containing protein [Microbacterium sp. HD4P20]MCP2637159.1 CYTH domain-containing protein [Microbacterium sp. HD4P20]